MPKPVTLVLFLVCLVHAKGKKLEYGTVIAIDLGTTYSSVGVYENGKVEIIPNEQGNRITPSYVAFTKQGERLIGHAAKNQLTSNPQNTIFHVKRLIGRTFDEKTVQEDIKHFPYRVINKNNKPYIVVQVEDGKDREFAPEEISAMILGKMKEIAEEYLGENVSHAVVTVPAYFNDAQRQATKDAATIAGLNVLCLINEPTSAAIAYGYNKLKEKNILVFDLGGGSFDVSLVTVLIDGKFLVQATNGNTHFGGEDFNQRVVDYFIELYKKKGKDIQSDLRAIQKLSKEVEKAKRALSVSNSANIFISGFLNGEDFSETLSRDKFEELNDDLFHSVLKPIQKVLKDYEIQKHEIHDVVLVGGSSRIPKIRQLIKEFFADQPIIRDVNLEETVVNGAAIYGGILGRKSSIKLFDDISPFTIGIETADGKMSVLFAYSELIDVAMSRVFFTSDQHTVNGRIFVGESPSLTENNHFLGEFNFTFPSSVADVKITFHLDKNGIFHLTAVDADSQKNSEINFTKFFNGLESKIIKKMKRNYKKFAREDKLYKERMWMKNDLESYAYELKNQINDNELFTATDKETLNESVQDVLDWLDISNKLAALDELELRRKELNKLYQTILFKLKTNEKHHKFAQKSHEEF